MKRNITLLLASTLVLLGSCTVSEPEQELQTTISPQLENCEQPAPPDGVVIGGQFEPKDRELQDIARGQKVYVPFVPQVSFDEVSTLGFWGFLIIRNTSETDSILLTSTRYYASNGQLVKDCLGTENLRLPPMATANLAIAKSDRIRGVGANFIVEWMSESEVSDPVIEAVMLTASGNQSFSFLSHGRVIEEYE